MPSRTRDFRIACTGAAAARRQVLLMDVETLEEFGIPPGRAKENITTRGIELSGLPLGPAHPRGGSAAGNHQAVHAVQSDGRNSGRAAGRIRGRRGILCRVVEAGKIRRRRIELMEVGSRQAKARQANHVGRKSRHDPLKEISKTNVSRSKHDPEKRRTAASHWLESSWDRTRICR